MDTGASEQLAKISPVRGGLLDEAAECKPGTCPVSEVAPISSDRAEVGEHLETYMVSRLFQHQLVMDAMCCASSINRDLSTIQVMSDEQADGGHINAQVPEYFTELQLKYDAGRL